MANLVFVLTYHAVYDDGFHTDEVRGVFRDPEVAKQRAALRGGPDITRLSWVEHNAHGLWWETTLPATVGYKSIRYSVAESELE